MLFKEFLANIDVKPKVALWISMICLVIVLVDRQFYLRALQDREKTITEMTAKLMVREDGNIKKEATLRRWEMELMGREKEVSAMLREVRAKTSR